MSPNAGTAAFAGTADENRVDFFELGKIGSGAEMAAVDELLNFDLRNVIDVGFPVVKHGNLGRIGVKAGDFVAGFYEAQRQRRIR